MVALNAFRRAVLIVAVLNLLYFGIEFAVALSIGSVSLLADSIDFLEDAAVNFLIVVAAAWPLTKRAKIGRLLSLLILVPALATAWVGITKIMDPARPSPAPLALAALGALIINVFCAFLLARHRRTEGSLARAAWLSARNDAIANVAIIAAAIASIWIITGWIDIVVGLGIAALNADAARAVWKAATAELNEARDAAV
ncbi:cation transporter [Microcella sp.]|uniref:cation transporter n=1 Tax=Microcella sp. TaxID=1913979 RepID=UPI00391B3643